MNFIGQLLPLIVVALIIWLIVARKLGTTMPRFSMPAPRPRPPKRTPLRMVKGAAMDRELTKLLKSEGQNRPD
jgi:hypothetical protein